MVEMAMILVTVVGIGKGQRWPAVAAYPAQLQLDSPSQQPLTCCYM